MLRYSSLPDLYIITFALVLTHLFPILHAQEKIEVPNDLNRIYLRVQKAGQGAFYTATLYDCIGRSPHKIILPEDARPGWGDIIAKPSLIGSPDEWGFIQIHSSSDSPKLKLAYTEDSEIKYVETVLPEEGIVFAVKVQKCQDRKLSLRYLYIRRKMNDLDDLILFSEMLIEEGKCEMIYVLSR